MKYVYPLALSLFTGLGVCASHAAPQHDTAHALIARIQAPHPDDEVVTWVQPQNQPVACKLHLALPASSPAVVQHASWDGACKDGFAFGTGRQSMTLDIRSGSAITRYTGGQSRPSRFYLSQNAPTMIVFGDLHTGTLLLMREPVATGGEHLVVGTMTREPGGVHYLSLFDIDAGDTRFIKRFPSGYDLYFRYVSDPLEPLAIEIFTRKQEALVGYVLYLYKNGAVKQVELEPGKAVPRPVQVPDAYLAFLDTSLREIRQKSAAAQNGAAPAVATSAAYRTAVCSQHASTAVPAQLCEEAAVHAAYASQVERIDTEREQRFTELRRTQQIDAPWQFAVKGYDPAAKHPLNSLDDAVQQYVQSMSRARLMQRHLQHSAADKANDDAS